MGRLKEIRVTRLGYCQYLLSSQLNFTLTHFAEHTQTVTHDVINHYLKDDKLRPPLPYGEMPKINWWRVSVDI